MNKKELALMLIGTLFIGLLFGINLGIVMMINSRNQYKNVAHECIETYKQSREQWMESRAELEKDVHGLFKDFSDCVKELTQCTEDLSSTIDKIK